jgi:predicted nucleotide-binding protein
MHRSTIFVGSSNEAEALAKAVGDLIDGHDGTEAVLWSALFPAGLILLEQIERLPAEIAGAVLVATPDVECRRGQTSFSAPTANVVFEYAYLSARLGRKRVSVLQIDDVDLPSDLQGVRHPAPIPERRGLPVAGAHEGRTLAMARSAAPTRA